MIGERILAAARGWRADASIVRATHERWDGEGYPDGSAGDEIPVAARIIAVCDAFSAMTSMRPYRLPVTRERRSTSCGGARARSSTRRSCRVLPRAAHAASRRAEAAAISVARLGGQPRLDLPW